ncbi:MAG: alpha/beta hydrolase [Gemmatimonadota bacterium]|nr:alpha/beta hydrolase [Gemmatimonadota bacterium]
MGSTESLLFDHRFIPGDGARAGLTLLLLHGTGGDGDSLLQLGYTLVPGASLLSPSGRVMEGNARRFFRRLAEGVFDLEDLAFRTGQLGEFIRGAARVYDLDRHRIVAIGHSNGANIAASLLLREADVLAGAVLFRPMVPFVPETPPLLSGIPVLICAGARDPMAPQGETDRLANLFRSADADVTVNVANATHDLAMTDVVAAREWLERNFEPAQA